MAQDSLFGPQDTKNDSAQRYFHPGGHAPLAVRMRPRSLDEVVGQQHLLAPGKPLRRLIEGDGEASVILYGPPGTGKTTIASLISVATGNRFVGLSALDSGVKEVRAVIDTARKKLIEGTRTVLFIDEVHRFSKTQQDALLAAVENRIVLLVAATTENPSFAVNAPLLSRSLLLQLESLGPEDLKTVVLRALEDERGFGGDVGITDDALDQLVTLAGGDARRALTYVEAAAEGARSIDAERGSAGDGNSPFTEERSGQRRESVAGSDQPSEATEATNAAGPTGIDAHNDEAEVTPSGKSSAQRVPTPPGANADIADPESSAHPGGSAHPEGSALPGGNAHTEGSGDFLSVDGGDPEDGAQSPTRIITLETLEETINKAVVRYDRDGDQHYDIISAFIKSVRGSDVDAALHYLARMIEGGEDPRFIARRLIILASEDIGMADPTALSTAVAAAQAVALIGMPEGRLSLAQATVHLALAPKSNSIITAIDNALADVRKGKSGPVPRHLRDGHYEGAKRVGAAIGYTYPHDDPRGIVTQRYMPETLDGATYYQPTSHGREANIQGFAANLRSIVRGGK